MKRVWQGMREFLSPTITPEHATRIECAAMSSLGIIAALPSASRAMAVSIAKEAERETLVAECAIAGVLVDKSLPLVELRERRDAALRGEK